MKYTFRYAVHEHRVTITFGNTGFCLELVGPQTAWHLRNLVRRANGEHRSVLEDYGGERWKELVSFLWPKER